MIHKHHIIPKHEWKVRFGSITDAYHDPDNIIHLTPEQHAEAHKLLFELNGSEYDKIAWLALSGHIGKEEATRSAVIFANTGKKASEATRQKMRMYHSGRPKSERHKKTLSVRCTGVPRSQAHKDACSRAHIGLKHSDTTKEKLRILTTGRKMAVGICPYCGISASICMLKRWHFDKCKHKGTGKLEI